MKIFISILLVVLGIEIRGVAQSFEKIFYNEKNKEEYYLALRPQSKEIKGVLVLLPGFGGIPEDNFPETKLFNVGHVNGLLTVSLAEGQKIYPDEPVTQQLNSILSDILKRYAVSKDQFVIGGFSAGGTIAFRYAEYCVENAAKVPVVPKGVFAVDSPLDLLCIYDYFQREIKKNFSEAGVFEARMITEKMNKEIGTPQTSLKRYNELTPFNHLLSEPGNEKFLKEMAVRVYEDVDVEWQLKNRRRSLYDSNALTASELINRLLLMGNERAEFITAKQHGVRSNGMSHPHSWSIVDEVECIQWCLKLFSAQ